MLFSSVAFVVFFTVFFLLYWLVLNRNLKLQNLLLLAGSYFFYAWWDWRFLILLFAYSLFNYQLGNYIYKVSNIKIKHYLTLIGSVVGIGLLFYFKYFNFFIASFASAFSGFNIEVNGLLFNVLLPLGISFYIFRTLSYVYDIKNGKLKPTGDWIVFFSFVAFFPSLLSGPIDKAKSFIPQLQKPRVFSYNNSSDAARQILWGLFKKVVIANQLALITDSAFDNYTITRGSALLLAVFYYAIQLYTDFSGYSDMAIGFARLLGFNPAQNFNFPFFSQNVAEFWRKWHMSLTSWVTEYVFTPLSIQFRDFGKAGLTMAILINIFVIGIWHGANWTFAAYGLLHGLYFIPLVLNGKLNKKRSAKSDMVLPGLKEVGNMVLTFTLISLSFILFRASTITQALQIVKRIFSESLFTHPVSITWHYVPLIAVFLFAEWLQRSKQFTLQINSLNIYLRAGIYYALLFTTILYSSSQISQFIYLKF